MTEQSTTPLFTWEGGSAWWWLLSQCRHARLCGRWEQDLATWAAGWGEHLIFRCNERVCAKRERYSNIALPNAWICSKPSNSCITSECYNLLYWLLQKMDGFIGHKPGFMLLSSDDCTIIKYRFYPHSANSSEWLLGNMIMGWKSFNFIIIQFFDNRNRKKKKVTTTILWISAALKHSIGNNSEQDTEKRHSRQLSVFSNFL